MAEQAPLIVWNDLKTMGVVRLDEDHHGIVDRFNQLVRASTHDDAAQIELGLDALLASADAHFNREESYIPSVESALLSRHVHQHELLLEELERLRRDYFLGDLEGHLSEALRTVASDLDRHLFREDLDISRVLGIAPGGGIT